MYPKKIGMFVILSQSLAAVMSGTSILSLTTPAFAGAMIIMNMVTRNVRTMTTTTVMILTKLRKSKPRMTVK
jgi:hypothetical protein